MTKILSVVKLLLPAFIPSWNFFDIIAPSPRIQYALFNSNNKLISNWEEFRPRPPQITFLENLLRLFWNPDWNENLFMMSCAERIMAEEGRENNVIVQHSEQEILSRIEKYLKSSTHSNEFHRAISLQFRLEIHQRNKANNKIEKFVCFNSAKHTFNK